MPEFRKMFPRRLAIGRALVTVRWMAVALFGIWLTVGGAIHIRAQVFRWQARRLLNEVRALEMEKTPAAEALKLRERWPRWEYGRWAVLNNQPCTTEKCDFTLAVGEWNGLIRLDPNRDTWWRLPLEAVLRGWEPFGLRRSEAIGEVTLRHGVVAGVGATVHTATRNGRWPFDLMAEATARPDLFPNGAPDEHPNLQVGYIGSPDHGGCEGCRLTRAFYTPQISREDFLRVTDFDVSCLTSFRLCKDFGDMMPEVKRIVEEDERRAKARGPASLVPCTARMIRTLGRDLFTIALMQVKRVGEGHPAAMWDYDGTPMPDAGEQDVEYELVEKLKWRSHEPVRTRVKHQFWFSGAMVDEKTHLLSHEVFRPGQRLLLLSSLPFLDCGAVPATAQNLAAVRAGIADDRDEFWMGFWQPYSAK